MSISAADKESLERIATRLEKQADAVRDVRGCMEYSRHLEKAALIAAEARYRTTAARIKAQGIVGNPDARIGR